MSDPMSGDQTYRLEEYKALRKEIELYLTESRSQERYTLIAVWVVWAWLITNKQPSGLLWSVPIILTLATSVRMIAMWKHFGIMGRYIRTLEDEFSVNGWEHLKKPWTLGLAFVVLNIVLLALAVAAFFCRHKLVR
jgi:hypothetical protein